MLFVRKHFNRKDFSVGALFGTGIIDPPWAYAQSKRHERLSGYSTHHEYPALTTEALKELPIKQLMDYGFLWTTWPFGGDAHELIKSWGMEPISMVPWIKVNQIEAEHNTFKPEYGVGYWFRGCVEPAILFKNPKVRSIRTNYVGLLSPNARHSRKPDSLHQLIENTKGKEEERFPGPFIELFARRKYPGWTTVGNELDGLDIREALSGLLACSSWVKGVGDELRTDQ